MASNTVITRHPIVCNFGDGISLLLSCRREFAAMRERMEALKKPVPRTEVDQSFANWIEGSMRGVERDFDKAFDAQKLMDLMVVVDDIFHQLQKAERGI